MPEKELIARKKCELHQFLAIKKVRELLFKFFGGEFEVCVQDHEVGRRRIHTSLFGLPFPFWQKEEAVSCLPRCVYVGGVRGGGGYNTHTHTPVSLPTSPGIIYGLR